MKLNVKILKGLSQALNDFSKLEDHFEKLDGDFSFIKNKNQRDMVETVYDWWVSSKLDSKKTKDMAIYILNTTLETNSIDEIIKKLQK
jgi:hypothetical protein